MTDFILRYKFFFNVWGPLQRILLHLKRSNLMVVFLL